ncbi:MAG: 23S rRNA (guanosine(2251)-2'-O)-methyltransferase RlmB [Bacilli bacterium]|nr:23S rRNA (guanosine(2251)-2'-O)-methyltransferase RlmB [Bacilli bacterium]
MYIYGKNVAIETLKKKKKINKAILYKNFKEEEILNLLIKNNIKIKYLEKYEMDKIVNGLHQGIILEVEDYKYVDIEELLIKENPLIVILDHLEDPHNLGAIIRTCEASGVDGIIIPKDRSVEVNATVIKTSVGTTENIKIARVTNIVNAINELKRQGFWIVGTDMNGTNYKKIDYKGKIAIVIGNEGSGMSRLVKDNIDFIASIPMYGKTNSLNASVAAGIIIYEAVTQRELG